MLGDGRKEKSQPVGSELLLAEAPPRPGPPQDRPEPPPRRPGRWVKARVASARLGRWVAARVASARAGRCATARAHGLRSARKVRIVLSDYSFGGRAQAEFLLHQTLVAGVVTIFGGSMSCGGNVGRAGAVANEWKTTASGVTH